jgi:methionyl-tRNA synthetase
MLKAVDLPLTTQLLTHSHWTVEGRKMSKSIGNVVDPNLVLEAYGIDAVRFYFARVGGRFKDDVGTSLAVDSRPLLRFCNRRLVGR